MKPEPIEPEKQLSKDLKTFAKLPEKTKELHHLADQAEKETGTNRAALDRLIQTKSKRK
ncbi:MAG: hypothetical protein RLZZ214_962 [Verrucomicrobiota bacterium]|jgi:hypothetical protein